MSTAIVLEKLGKKYTIRSSVGQPWSLRDAIKDGMKQVVRRFLTGKLARKQDFWALSDVSLQVEQGERIGIIGRNGAGKSTLLKLLSRVTEPSAGRIYLRGRIASLLEVGTGFHPELSGRENVFLNGSILGMSRREIRNRFDKIVDFADIENFIDTPVKRYSSGMFMRLAFSVAAHLEPDILLVDEVLAVGDAQFQRKCLGKMESVSKESGRTVLFVSHNMAAISSLCPRTIYLTKGRVDYMGNTSDAILKYFAATEGGSPSHVKYSQGEFSDESVELLSGQVDPGHKSIHDITIHDSIAIKMTYRVRTRIKAALVPNVHFVRIDGTLAFISNAQEVATSLEPGEYEAVCMVPGDLMNDGAYMVGLAITKYDRNSHNVCFFDRNALSLNIRDPMDSRSSRHGYGRPIPGAMRPRLQWTLRRVDR